MYLGGKSGLELDWANFGPIQFKVHLVSKDTPLIHSKHPKNYSLSSPLLLIHNSLLRFFTHTHKPKPRTYI